MQYVPGMQGLTSGRSRVTSLVNVMQVGDVFHFASDCFEKKSAGDPCQVSGVGTIGVHMYSLHWSDNRAPVPGGERPVQPGGPLCRPGPLPHPALSQVRTWLDCSRAMCSRISYSIAMCYRARYSKARCSRAICSRAMCSRAMCSRASCLRERCSRAMCYRAGCSRARFSRERCSGVRCYIRAR